MVGGLWVRKKTAAGAAEEAPTPGGLVDKTGNHGYLMKVMNEDLMPKGGREEFVLFLKLTPDEAGAPTILANETCPER